MYREVTHKSIFILLSTFSKIFAATVSSCRQIEYAFSNYTNVEYNPMQAHTIIGLEIESDLH